MHFLLAPKHHWNDLLKQCDTLACTLQKGLFFSGFFFHLVQNGYHKPSPLAAGHLIFADSVHYRSLPHTSVKSREQTQAKFSLLKETGCCFVVVVVVVVLFCFFRKQYLVTHSKSAPLPWIEEPVPEDGKPPLPPKTFTTPPGPQAWLDPKALLSDVLSCQCLSHVQLFSISWGAVCQVSLSINNSWSLLKLMFIRSVMPPNNFIFYLPLCLLPVIFPCIRVFSSESVLPINWPKYWRFSFSIGPSN